MKMLPEGKKKLKTACGFLNAGNFKKALNRGIIFYTMISTQARTELRYSLVTLHKFINN